MTRIAHKTLVEFNHDRNNYFNNKYKHKYPLVNKANLAMLSSSLFRNTPYCTGTLITLSCFVNQY